MYEVVLKCVGKTTPYFLAYPVGMTWCVWGSERCMEVSPAKGSHGLRDNTQWQERTQKLRNWGIEELCTSWQKGLLCGLLFSGHAYNKHVFVYCLLFNGDHFSIKTTLSKSRGQGERGRENVCHRGKRSWGKARGKLGTLVLGKVHWMVNRWVLDCLMTEAIMNNSICISQWYDF